MLNRTDQQRIAAAVADAEARTTGEIVPVIAPQSDGYHDVALACSALVALIALAAFAFATAFSLDLIDRLFGLWSKVWSPAATLRLALVLVMITFCVLWLLMQWRPLRLCLTPPLLKTRRAHARAQTCFRLAVQGRTSGRTGVVLYVSLAERRAVILADAAISAHVDPAVWGQAMQDLLAEVRQGDLAAGVVAAVGRIGAVLAQAAPSAAHPDNQLPDGPIEL